MSLKSSTLYRYKLPCTKKRLNIVTKSISPKHLFLLNMRGFYILDYKWSNDTMVDVIVEPVPYPNIHTTIPLCTTQPAGSIQTVCLKGFNPLWSDWIQYNNVVVPSIPSDLILSEKYKIPHTFVFDLNVISDVLEICKQNNIDNLIQELKCNKKTQDLYLKMEKSPNIRSDDFILLKKNASDSKLSSLAICIFAILTNGNLNIASSLIEKASANIMQTYDIETHLKDNLYAYISVLSNPSVLKNIKPLKSNTPNNLDMDQVFKIVKTEPEWWHIACCILKLEILTLQLKHKPKTEIFSHYTDWMFNEHVTDIIMISWAYVKLLHKQVNYINILKSSKKHSNPLDNAIWDIYYLRELHNLKLKTMNTYVNKHLTLFEQKYGNTSLLQSVFITNDKALLKLNAIISNPIKYITDYHCKEYIKDTELTTSHINTIFNQSQQYAVLSNLEGHLRNIHTKKCLDLSYLTNLYHTLQTELKLYADV